MSLGSFNQRHQALRFNFAPQIDPHFLKGVLMPLDMDKLTSPFLLAKAAQSLKELPCFYDFSTPFRRLALLPRLQQIKLVMYAGAAGHHHQLKKIIKAQEVENLKDILGSALGFTLKVAPLLSPPKITTPLPTTTSGFASAGHQMLVRAAVGEPTDLQTLWALRFPPSLKWGGVAGEKSKELAAFFVRVANQMKK